MRRFSIALLGAAVAAGLLNACALKLDYRPLLQGYIRHTEALARAYSYSVAYGDHHAQVDVRVADDFRYQAAYTLDGRTEATEIVSDDSRAVQVDDPALLTRFKPGPAAPSSGSTTVAPTGAAIPIGSFLSPNRPLDAASLSDVSSGQWVLDTSGSYGILKPPTTGKPLASGVDPVGDALRVLADLDTYVGALNSDQVVRFNPEAGYYFKDLDPFPKPASGEQRFDIALSQSLAPRSALNDSPEQRRDAIPLADYFESAAIYVRNGTVASIDESVNIALRLKLPDQDIVARLKDADVKVPANIGSLSVSRQAAVLDQVLNKFYASREAPPLVQRYVSVDFMQLGGDIAPITLPPDPIKASLAGIFDRGQILGGGS